MREGWLNLVMVRLFRHRQTKGAETDKPNLKLRRPALYSTYYSLLFPLDVCRVAAKRKTGNLILMWVFAWGFSLGLSSDKLEIWKSDIDVNMRIHTSLTRK